MLEGFSQVFRNKEIIQLIAPSASPNIFTRGRRIEILQLARMFGASP